MVDIGPRLPGFGGPISFNEIGTHELVAEADELHRDICRRQRTLLASLAELSRREVWDADGCRDMGHWVACRYGVSATVGARWVDAGIALDRLPRLSSALETGELCLDKTVQLARFIATDEEEQWIAWARRVTVATVRSKADVMTRKPAEEAADLDRVRSFERWWIEDGRLLQFAGILPADQGALLIAAVDRVAATLEAPEGLEGTTIEQRRADALVALATRSTSPGGSTDRATIVVNAQLAALRGDGSGASLESGGVVPPQTLRKLTCDGRIATVLSDGERGVVGIGRASRAVPDWLHRQLQERDDGCSFPGCGARRYLQAHHIVHWADGGPTDLDNLVLVCGFHHKLVHEYGWKVRLDGDVPVWSRPGGRTFEPGLPRGPGGMKEPTATSRSHLIPRVLAATL